MTHARSQGAAIVVLVAFLIMLTLLSPQATPVQADGPCALSVTLYGGGRVEVAGAARMEGVNNELALACGEAVELTAVPRERWRFTGWQGADVADPLAATISVAAGAALTATFELQGVVYEQLDAPVMGRNGRFTTQIARLDPNWQSPQPPRPDNAPNAAPVIDIWYGSEQTFGQLGTPQDWVNILGNVSDADGNLSTLTYRLNGGASRSLNVGPDRRRLYNEGDFNIDIARAQLSTGSNEVIITARDTLGSETQATVTINYSSANVWPLPYSFDWSTTGEIQDVVQVVDGKWGIHDDAAYPQEMGYDRLLAIGDLTWGNYEITVPVTINQLDPGGYNDISGSPAVGVVLRWEGHTDIPVACSQPQCGYLPIGVASWYDWEIDDEGFLMWNSHSLSSTDNSGKKLTLGTTYLWKVRAETPPGTNGYFQFKVWEQGTQEPPNWLLTFTDTNGQSLRNGSLLLLAHHADVSFGDPQVTPLGGDDNTPPGISNVQVVPGSTSAAITWTTNEPATSRVDYGETAVYGQYATDEALKTNHTIILPNLELDRDYHFRITSTDQAGNDASTNDATFRTTTGGDVVSDDFNACELNADLWTFSDPLGDAGYRITGQALEIDVPAGASHDVWPSDGEPLIRAPHMMQPATDPNEIEVKFESGVSDNIQMQGLLIQQDAENLLRVNVQYDNDGKVRLYAIGFKSGRNPSLLRNVTLPDSYAGGPIYLRVMRSGSQWQVSYAQEPNAFVATNEFTFALAVAQVGVFAGSASQTNSAPAFTAVVDYFFNSASPIDSEDGNALVLPVSVVGSGGVQKDAECGNPVTLTAVPAPGWQFSRWQGAPLNGLTDAEVEVQFEIGDAVTAVFTEAAYTIDVTVVNQNGGTVTLEPEKDTYSYGDKVTVTAVPKTGWLFSGWSEDLEGAAMQQTITVENNVAITATFTPDQISLFLPMIRR